MKIEQLMEVISHPHIQIEVQPDRIRLTALLHSVLIDIRSSQKGLKVNRPSGDGSGRTKENCHCEYGRTDTNITVNLGFLLLPPKKKETKWSVRRQIQPLAVLIPFTIRFEPKRFSLLSGWWTMKLCISNHRFADRNCFLEIYYTLSVRRDRQLSILTESMKRF